MSLVQPATAQHGVDFSPGFLDTPDPVTLPPGATPDARNAFLYRIEHKGTGKTRTTMGVRPGHLLLTPAAAPATRHGTGLHEFRLPADTQLLAKIGTAWFKFNNTSAWVAIPSATGYTDDTPGRIGVLKNEAVLHDGAVQQIYDGTAVRPVGFARPTGVTNMTAGAGPGPTGTFTARYTWYDQTHAHESSPTTAATAPLAITNQSRVHTKPSGSPPANVTHWRIYVRREDIYERYWMYVGQEAVATATFTEAILDAARRSRMPEDYENEPPSVVFHILETWNGFGIGFTLNSSTMHVSKQGDLESWDPSHVFTGVLTQGGDYVTSALNYGTEFVIQKPTQSFHLIGDRLPFKVEDLQSGFGNISQESAMEVEGLFYAWDRDKGPYRTDLGATWEPLGDARIEQTLATLVKAHIPRIRIGHDKTNSLICWAVPTSTDPNVAARLNTLLVYNYRLNCWYPPTSGLLIGAMTSCLLPGGPYGLFAVDAGANLVTLGGRLYRLFAAGATRDGPTTGTVRGTLTQNSVDGASIVDTTAAFNTVGDGLKLLEVRIRPPGGLWQRGRHVTSNASNSCSVNPIFDVVPLVGWEYAVGVIDWHWYTPPFDAGQMDMRKRGGWLTLQQGRPVANQYLDVGVRFDQDLQPSLLRTFNAAGYVSPSDYLRPAGDLPAFNQWTALSGGSKWAEVDDPLGAPDEDASYIFLDTTALVQGFRCAAPASQQDRIISQIVLEWRARTTLGGSMKAFPVIDGRIVVDSADATVMTTAYANYSRVFPLHPVTGNPWQMADLRRGFEFVLQAFVAGFQIRVTSAAVRVDFVNPPLPTMRQRLHRSFMTAQLRFTTAQPDARIEILQYRLDADLLPRRRVRSAP